MSRGRGWVISSIDGASETMPSRSAMLHCANVGQNVPGSAMPVASMPLPPISAAITEATAAPHSSARPWRTEMRTGPGDSERNTRSPTSVPTTLLIREKGMNSAGTGSHSRWASSTGSGMNSAQCGP